jgi:simple sugar transport system permease protein
MKIRNFIIDNLVVIIFVAFTAAGFIFSEGVSFTYFMNELIDRVFRNCFLVLSLIIPVIAGLGLNFGIVVGAIAGQIAIVFVRYHGMGGLGALMLCFLLALPLAMLFGFLTGKLYNRTRGQEMIASLIVGYFANGLYYFLFLFAVGKIIPVKLGNPLVKFDGIGVRMSVDLGARIDGGMKYALDNIIRIPFMYLILIASLGILIYLIVKHISGQKKAEQESKNLWSFRVYCGLCVIVILLGIVSIVTDNDLMKLRRAPFVTAMVIVSLCFFITFLMKTKLGQDFRSVGHNQHIAEVSGINVDRTRIIATMFSTVLAAWGMIIYLQNMGTLATYDSHRNIGLFSVAALLVGGASTSRASVKNALAGAALFNSMTIISPELGLTLFGDAGVGEYFRSFMVYGVIGLALGLYVWKNLKASREQNAL